MVLTRHVTYLPAILLVLCFCWGITLGQNGAAPASGINSTIIEENHNSTQPDSNQAPPGPIVVATDPTTTPTTTVQTPSTTTVSSSTPSTTMASTITSTMMSSTTPSTKMSSTTPSTTMISTTPSTTISSTTPSTTMTSTTPSTKMTSTTPSTTMVSTMPSTAMSSTMSSTTMPSTTPSTTMTSTTPSTTMASTMPSTTMSSTMSSTTMPSTTPSTTMTSTTPSTTMASTMPPTTMSSTMSSTTMPSTTPSTKMTSTTPSTTMASTMPPTTMSSTMSSTTMPSTTPSTKMTSTTPSTTMASTMPPTTMSSTMSSITMPSTTPSTKMTSTTPSTTMSSTMPSTTMSSTMPSTTMSPTTPSTPISSTTQDPTATTSAGTPIAGGIGGGTTIIPTVSRNKLGTTPMKPMIIDTTTRPPRQYSTAAPVAAGSPRAVTVSKENDTTVVMQTTKPNIRQTNGPTVGSLPPFVPTTKYRDTGAQRTTMGPVLPGQTTTAYRSVVTDTDSVTTARMTPPQRPIMTTMLRQTTAKVLPVRTSPLRTTSKPISTTAYDHGGDQTGPDTTSPKVKATTTGPVMSTTPPIVSTTKITQVTKMTTTIPTAPPVSTTETSEIPKDVTYSIRFEGDCNIILSDSGVRERFEQNFIETYSGKLGVPKDNILLQGISCGSVDVLCRLIGIQQSKVEKSLDEVVAQPAPLIVNADGQTYAYNPVGYTLADPPGPTSEVPAPGKPASDPTILAPAPPSKLRNVDMIIIIVVSIIGGLLIIIIIALIIHECRRRSHTKSFDLRGTPRPHIHTEDFTLTKMERGPAEYNDYGLVVNTTSNGHTKTPQVGVATIVETPNRQNGEAMHNGYHKAAKEEYGPEYDAGPDSPSISLMKSMRTPEVEGGIENPSFSSEDILDSGTETDKELVSSDKGLDSPDHVPLQVYPSAESDSGRQSDSLTELPTDTPPQHSPRSNLSDNTGSDHTYEPFETPTTLDIPQSPASHEVLMPIEEVSYPSEATEEPPQSHTSPDVMSHNPEHGSYEMMETRSPGKRESDIFAPSEGATAF